MVIMGAASMPDLSANAYTAPNPAGNDDGGWVRCGENLTSDLTRPANRPSNRSSGPEIPNQLVRRYQHVSQPPRSGPVGIGVDTARPARDAAVSPRQAARPGVSPRTPGARPCAARLRAAACTGGHAEGSHHRQLQRVKDHDVLAHLARNRRYLQAEEARAADDDSLGDRELFLHPERVSDCSQNRDTIQVMTEGKPTRLRAGGEDRCVKHYPRPVRLRPPPVSGPEPGSRRVANRVREAVRGNPLPPARCIPPGSPLQGGSDRVRP